MTPKEPRTPEEKVAMERYWTARTKFERVLLATPPELLGLTSDDIEQVISDIDPPRLERPKPRPRVAASK
jgi:hypothetical protein